MKYLLVSALTIISFFTSSAWSGAEAVTFTPPVNNAPKVATGGASRGSFFVPKRGNTAPRQATGGASRGNIFTPRSGNGVPRNATGGASRNGQQPSIVAASGPATLIAVLPQSYYGTTLSERPTLMVYLPASNAQEASLSIKDEAGNMHYQMTIPVARKSGIIAVKLPENAPALAVGKSYQWLLGLKVDGKLGPSTPYVDGWIERIQPNAELLAAMQQPDAFKRAKAFGKNGVWYDCVATMAKLYAAQPNNSTVVNGWQELLSSVSLKDIAKAPLVSSAN